VAELVDGLVGKSGPVSGGELLGSRGVVIIC